MCIRDSLYPCVIKVQSVSQSVSLSLAPSLSLFFAVALCVLSPPLLCFCYPPLSLARGPPLSLSLLSPIPLLSFTRSLFFSFSPHSFPCPSLSFHIYHPFLSLPHSLSFSSSPPPLSGLNTLGTGMSTVLTSVKLCTVFDIKVPMSGGCSLVFNHRGYFMSAPRSARIRHRPTCICTIVTQTHKWLKKKERVVVMKFPDYQGTKIREYVFDFQFPAYALRCS